MKLRFANSRALRQAESLSLSESEINTAPCFGSGPNAAVWLLANAMPKLDDIPITSPVDFISGPSTESTPVPSTLRKRFHGRTASLTETPFATPSPNLGSNPISRSSEILLPVAIKEAALASATRCFCNKWHGSRCSWIGFKYK